jgi:hypothetical protein
MQPRQEAKTTRNRCNQITYLGRKNSGKYCQVVVGINNKQMLRDLEQTLTFIVKGPRGLDKILISPDGDITVTNDGATILSQVFPPIGVCPLLSDADMRHRWKLNTMLPNCW